MLDRVGGCMEARKLGESDGDRYPRRGHEFGRGLAPEGRGGGWHAPRHVLVIGLALIVLANEVVSAHAAIGPTPDRTYVTNGAVNAITVAQNGTAYIGGQFT